MLEAREVSFLAGGNRLLDRVSVALAPGELLALLGENGAGKSTLLKVLTGDLTPGAGEVVMNKSPLHSWPTRKRARARAVLPQNSQVAFGFTVLEVVLLGRYPFCGGMPAPSDYAIARAALAQTDAAHLESRLMPTLSGGERGRVQIARALAQVWAEESGEERRYLLLDEPTASLDLAHQHAILQLMRDLAEQHGLGVLAVLHDLNLAARYAHRLALMKHGRVIGIGDPELVLSAERISECFGVQVIVGKHPERGCPLVVAA